MDLFEIDWDQRRNEALLVYPKILQIRARENINTLLEWGRHWKIIFCCGKCEERYVWSFTTQFIAEVKDDVLQSKYKILIHGELTKQILHSRRIQTIFFSYYCILFVFGDVRHCFWNCQQLLLNCLCATYSFEVGSVVCWITVHFKDIWFIMFSKTRNETKVDIRAFLALCTSCESICSILNGASGALAGT